MKNLILLVSLILMAHCIIGQEIGIKEWTFQYNYSFGNSFIGSDVNASSMIEGTHHISFQAAGLEFDKGQLLLGMSFQRVHANSVSEGLAFECGAAGTLTNKIIEYKSEANYLGLPLSVKMNMPIASPAYWKFNLEPQIKVKNEEVQVVQECQTPHHLPNIEILPTERNKLLWQSSIGVGYEIELVADYAIFIEPNVRYTLNQIYTKDQMDSERVERINGNLLTLGLSVGIIIK